MWIGQTPSSNECHLTRAIYWLNTSRRLILMNVGMFKRENHRCILNAQWTINSNRGGRRGNKTGKLIRKIDLHMSKIIYTEYTFFLQGYPERMRLERQLFFSYIHGSLPGFEKNPGLKKKTSWVIFLLLWVFIGFFGPLLGFSIWK